MSRTQHARKPKTERRVNRPSLYEAHTGTLGTIAKESKTASEFARRAEAWNASNARQLSDRELVDAYMPAYQRATDLHHRAALRNLEQLVRMARETRLASRHKLWNKLANDVDNGVES